MANIAGTNMCWRPSGSWCVFSISPEFPQSLPKSQNINRMIGELQYHFTKHYVDRQFFFFQQGNKYIRLEILALYTYSLLNSSMARAPPVVMAFSAAGCGGRGRRSFLGFCSSSSSHFLWHCGMWIGKLKPEAPCHGAYSFASQKWCNFFTELNVWISYFPK